MKSQYIFVEEISLIFQQNFVVKFQHVFAGKKLVNFSHIKYIKFSNSELKRMKVSGSRLYSVSDHHYRSNDNCFENSMINECADGCGERREGQTSSFKLSYCDEQWGQ